MDKKKIIMIISFVSIFIILIGILIYIKCFKNEKQNLINNENDYIESLDIDLNNVLKKDRKLILEAMNNIPYANGLYQSIYKDSLNIENIKNEVLFYKAYYTDIKKTEKNTDEYNSIVDNETFDFLIRKEDILNKIYELYDIKLDSLNSYIELIDKKATLYNDYYGFNDYNNTTNIYKMSKVINYIIGNDNLVIYEKALFYTYDKENKLITIYNDDTLHNKLLELNIDLDLEKIKDIFNKNIDKFNTYENTFKIKNNKYYWYSIVMNKELEK